MADNTEEEHLDNPTNTQPANLPDEIIPITDSETITKNQEIQIMEVHKHPHHVTHKKKWGEYLLEFLMLFLAVFLGFVAENIREEKVEHNREINYAKQLLVELEADVVKYSDYARRLEIGMKKHKEFSKMMTASKPPSNYELTSAFYKLYYTYRINVTSVTYSQMKFSGTLRYIQNRDIINSLQEYYEKYQTRIESYSRDQENFYSKYMEPFVLNHFLSTDIDDLGDSVIVANPIYLNRTRETDIQLTNIMETEMHNIATNLERSIQPTIPNAKNLIALLKVEYHIE